MRKNALTKREKVLKSIEYRTIVKGGKRKSTEHFKIFIWPNSVSKRRLGITASRRVGSAVKRNRIKRLVREYFRLHKSCLPPSSDLLFIAKPGADRLDYTQLCDELKKVFCG
ncbi:MAG: ribonuclease P protein component [Thermodesulfobacteriota bacterium]|nr:ribonuclease P protein component [Thermodesulfobacteriota bacterium]